MQESDEYPIPESMCNLTITRKVSVWGTADHETSLYDKSFTYKKTKVDVMYCRVALTHHFVWKHGTKTNIELNQNTYAYMCMQVPNWMAINSNVLERYSKLTT